MTTPSSPPARPAPAIAGRLQGSLVVAVVVAAAYSAWASGTPPFTIGADVAVSVPSALFAATLVLQWRWPSARPWRRIAPGRPATATATDARSAAPWIVLAAVLLAVELASYFHGGARSAYPTISSGLDALFRSRAAKAVVWDAWLSAGWFLARR